MVLLTCLLCGSLAAQSGSPPGRGFPRSAPWVSCYGSAANMRDLTKVARTFRIISILGSMEASQTYWTKVPAGFVAGRDNRTAHLGSYAGYPDEIWMNLGNAAYQHLILDYVAPRLVAQGADGFYLDNLELVEHQASDPNGPSSPACRQLIVMQNATSDVTRLGRTGGAAFPSLLDRDRRLCRKLRSG